MSFILYAFVILVGLVVGSFLNVCILRLPEEDQSIVSPASRCPRCGHPIRWTDNLPVLSYLLLRGRCRDCGAGISPRYPLVEGLTGLMAALLLWNFGLGWKFLFSFIFTCALLVITFIDYDHQIIPDVISLPGIPLGFLAAVLFMGLTFWDALLGVLAGGGFLFLVAFGYELLTKREGMGGGDIKLLAMLGAFLGWQSLLFIVLVSSLLGAAVGLTAMAVKGQDMKYAIPFGPFLCVAGVAWLFVGPEAMRLFLRG